MKAIVIGTSLAGKTTLVKYFRGNTNLYVREIDEEVEEKNGGEWPVDDEYRLKVLAPKIIKEILSKEKVIFFTNSDYFSNDNLEEARKKGFKIVQLELELDSLKKRNKLRMKYEGYDDFSKFLDGMLSYQERIKKDGLVDLVIDANKPTESIVKEIIDFVVTHLGG